MRDLATLCIAAMLLACTDGSTNKDDGDTDTPGDTDDALVALAATVHVINLHAADGISASSLAVRTTDGFSVDATVPYFARTEGKALELDDGTEVITFEVFQPGAPDEVLATAASELTTRRSYDLLLTGAQDDDTLRIQVLEVPATTPAPNLSRIRFVHAAAAFDTRVDVWVGGDAIPRGSDLGLHDISDPFDMNPNLATGDTLTITPAGTAPGEDDILVIRPNALFEVGAHHLVALVHPPLDGSADTDAPVNVVVFDR